MYIIPELWEIIKDFLIKKPKEKSFPPYVWIHIKDYMLQEYWMRQFNSVLTELPKCQTYRYTDAWIKSGYPFCMYSSATIKPRFVKTFHANVIATNKDPIITYEIYKTPILESDLKAWKEL